jgi:co-chaperonin GroES (HSP10)
MIVHDRIRAFGEWVLVRADPPPEKSAGGIFRPAGNIEDRLGLLVGTVLSVGQGRRTTSKPGRPAVCEFIPMEVEEGDKIVFRGHLHDLNKYHQGIEGFDHSMVHIADVIGIVEDDDTIIV